jgi:hypothetical protein
MKIATDHNTARASPIMSVLSCEKPNASAAMDNPYSSAEGR